MASNTVETRRRDKRSAERQAELRRSPSLEAAPLRGRPANENDPGSSLMMARLHRQPSYMAYYVAISCYPGLGIRLVHGFIRHADSARQALPKLVRVRRPAGFAHQHHVGSWPISFGAPSNCARFRKF